MWLLFAYVSSTPRAEPLQSETASTPNATPGLTVQASEPGAIEAPVPDTEASQREQAVAAPVKAAEEREKPREAGVPTKRRHAPRARPNPAERARDLRPEDF
jgi:hypothetical protein